MISSLSMEDHKDIFFANLSLLLSTFCSHEYVANTNAHKDSTNSQKLLDIILSKNGSDIVDELQSDIIKKVYQTIYKNYDMLLKRNTDLFTLKDHKNGKNVKVTIIPAIVLSNMWDTLASDEQVSVWNNLSLMFVASYYMVNMSNNITDDKINIPSEWTDFAVIKRSIEDFMLKFPTSKLLTIGNSIMSSSKNINPFRGVGTGDLSDNYSISHVRSGPEILSDQTKPGLSGLAKMFGVDNVGANMDAFMDALKNMTPEQLDEAENKIKDLMNGTFDDNTTKIVSSMISEIKTELSNTDDLTKGNPMKNIMKIAETISKKALPAIEKSDVDLKNIISQTKGLADKIAKGPDGKSLFPEGQNPLGMMMNYVENNIEKMNDKGKTPEEEYNDQVAQMASMLQSMGIKNVTADSLKNMNMNDIYESCEPTPKNKNKKK